jgi:hypothetical protein
VKLAKPTERSECSYSFGTSNWLNFVPVELIVIEPSLAGIQVEFFCRLMRTRTPFIDSLVLSFFENIRMVMSAKIELCVIRQILLNLIFLMTDY